MISDAEKTLSTTGIDENHSPISSGDAAPERTAAVHAMKLGIGIFVIGDSDSWRRPFVNLRTQSAKAAVFLVRRRRRGCVRNQTTSG